MKHLKRFPEFIRFVMVGILATALHYGIYFLLQRFINEENNRTSHQIIEEYTQSDLSTDPVFMKNVLQKVMEEMPADSYGLVLSSHGSGWVPNSIFDKHVMAPSTR